MRLLLPLPTFVLLLAACAGDEATSPAALDRIPMLAKGGGGAVVVSGSGHLTFTQATTDWRSFSFHVVIDEDGAARGRYQLHARQSLLESVHHGDIVCATVVGNAAWMVGVNTKSTNPGAPPGTYTTWRVIDNGEGAGDPPDEISLMGVGIINPPPFCVNLPGTPVFPIEAGNIQIH